MKNKAPTPHRLMILAVTTLLCVAAVGQAQTTTTSAGGDPPNEAKVLAPDSSSADTFQEQKRRMKANVEMWEARVYKRLTAVAEIRDTMDFSDLTTQKLAVDELKELLKQLDGAAKEILDAYGHAGPDLKFYRRALEEGPAVFQRIADDFDRKATEKRSPALKEAYADFGDQARQLAIRYAERAKTVDSWEREIHHKIEYVEESREFIHDAQELLDAIPTEAGLETQKLVKQINSYMQAFDEALKAMRGVAEKIGDPQPKTGKDEPAKDAKQSTTSSVLGDYRRRLADLKR
ncbi:MAG: hypothetical protein JNM18_01150 [Planctomycetaceae bacterium]|nr:hypothetical protein [Planctomycetaceae bacterium]